MSDQALELRDLTRQHRDRELDARHKAESSQPTKRRRIAVMSGKGGVGKSVLSIQLACALAESAGRVLLVDANPMSPSLHVLTNQHAAFSIQDLLTFGRQPERLPLPEIIPNLSLLSNARLDDDAERISSANATFFLESLAPYTAAYDYVVFDTQTGLDDWNIGIIERATDVFFVTLTEPASIIDTYSVVKGAFQHGLHENFWLIINQMLSPQSGNEAHEKLNLALKHFLSYEITLLGSVSFDYELKTLVDSQGPFWEKTHRKTSAKSIQVILKQYLEEISVVAGSNQIREVML